MATISAPISCPATQARSIPSKSSHPNPDVIVVNRIRLDELPRCKGFVSVGPARPIAPRIAAPFWPRWSRRRPSPFHGRAEGDVHAIWHQFYASPNQFVAIAEMAKWFHPELFADVDADATFKEFYDKFLPIEYEPGAWLSLKAGGVDHGRR